MSDRKSPMANETSVASSGDLLVLDGKAIGAIASP
jgi:hypothetical protein